MFRSINTAGTAILFATHNLELVRRNPHIRLIELAQGRIIHDSAVEQTV